MRPLSDVLSISREKLAFIVDATSAPVASITPISSWIGFEIGLIQAELDKIAAANTDGAPINISLNGLAVFLESIKFRYCESGTVNTLVTVLWHGDSHVVYFDFRSNFYVDVDANIDYVKP